jgi:hypothetical protein
MLASNSILNAFSTVLTSNDLDQVKTNANSMIASIQSGVESPQIVDSTQKMRIRLRQLEKSKDFQLRANIGVRSVAIANNSLIDMGIDKKRNVPEDPAYSTPDGSNFFIFSGRYVRDTMCVQQCIFFQLFRVHFHTFKTGT